MRHVRKGDEVMILAGREKGKKGRILRVDTERGRAFIEKVNLVKRHIKPNPQAPQGGIIEKEASLALSNLMLVCPRCGKASRTGRKVLESGVRTRTCKKCCEQVDKK